MNPHPLMPLWAHLLPSCRALAAAAAMAALMPVQAQGRLSAVAVVEAEAEVDAWRTPEQLQALLAPVALYPDALVALILPAATRPSDLVLVARHLAAGGTVEAVEAQPWEDAAKALARYPEVVHWLDANLEWTRRVGEAFLAQPEDVMAALQRLREQARTSGALTSTPEQEVVVEQAQIRIVPAQPQVIYVPRYDPQVVFVERPRPHYGAVPWITFGLGYPVGSWLAYECDWRRRSVVVIHRPHRGQWWAARPDWRHRYRADHGGIGVGRGHWERWRAPAPRQVWPRGERPEPFRPRSWADRAARPERRWNDFDHRRLPGPVPPVGESRRRGWERPNFVGPVPAGSDPGVAPSRIVPSRPTVGPTMPTRPHVARPLPLPGPHVPGRVQPARPVAGVGGALGRPEQRFTAPTRVAPPRGPAVPRIERPMPAARTDRGAVPPASAPAPRPVAPDRGPGLQRDAL